MNNERFIYVLVDPLTDEIRYLGQTGNIRERLKGHIDDARLAPHLNPLKARWINSLVAQGLKPKITVLEICTASTVIMRERKLIYEYKQRYPNLLNGQIIVPIE